ncbi:hypothetical protein [Micropruina sp.]|uniref:hypothetical protein n=1 Tax=Micropruina sp. TaxID=2737536 RepID=UPI002608A09A|nr:hypothetical protein [Micropruina sp.]
MTIASSPRELRIRAEGRVPASLSTELGDMVVTRLPPGVELCGRLPDATLQWGLLHRLQRAGLRLRSVDRVEPGSSRTFRGSQSAPAASVPLLRIEVQGHAAALIAAALHSEQVYQAPPSTTLVMPLTSDRVLFNTLWELEALALDVLGLHVEG